ncbi:DUF1467 family protein [Sphingomicrobium sp. XHP0239]|uniref:DUF1467 family protein n=1 Tax=Sphingomicrobium maritimum TaxID=3133972 RepID=UPI0031CC6C5D
MEPVSILAIFFLVFVFAAFVTLPIGVRTDQEMGEELIPGQAESAPHRFDLPRHLVRAAVIALPLTALIVANLIYGWVTTDMLGFPRF